MFQSLNKFKKTAVILAALSMSASAIADANTHSVAAVKHATESPLATYGYETVNGNKIFYREAGDTSKPTLVLLHGFPSSSHQYRNLITLLKDDYHLIAPDYLGFGASDFPSQEDYQYSFDNFAVTINQFLEQKGVKKYSLVIQDYGAPVGMRIALKHPERVQAIITQNGNAYEEGLNKETWAPIMQLWEKRTPELEQQIKDTIFSFEGLRWQYTHGTRNPDAILPDNWMLDFERFSRQGQHELQLDLFYDYQNNVKAYPQWQAYLRKHQPPVLAVWAKNDAFFPVEGAYGFKKDVTDFELNILDTGHFALEEDAPLIADKVKTFLSARGIK